MYRPIVAITIGDVAGIGPEIIVKKFVKEDILAWCRSFVLGETQILKKALDLLSSSVKVMRRGSVEEMKFKEGEIEVIDFRFVKSSALRAGFEDAEYGEAAVEYTKIACQLALDGKIEAMVSAPLNKESMRMAGCKYEGPQRL